LDNLRGSKALLFSFHPLWTDQLDVDAECLLAGSIIAIPFRYCISAYQAYCLFIKENRTFDNYFGTYPGANGATTALDLEGETIPLQHEQDQVPDIDHSFEGVTQAYNNGKMDQFDLLSSGGTLYKVRRTNPYANNSLTQMYQSDIPNY